MRKVIVTNYQEQWEEGFKKGTAKLEKVFKDILISIHHIGSTAVKELKAKPIIDILPVVNAIDQVDSHNQKMYELGYTPLGEYGISGRRFFKKGVDQRTHHVHIYQAGNPHIDRHLAFRDYLRAHSQTAKEYGDKKEWLAIQYPYDIESYIKEKDMFVKQIEQQALKWYEGKQ
ncbi:hypothetical protein M948_17545 [Virgibacillus sp. CM-4]|uniref:GrpB family protein n=1 Tax=Virgibacillus sp. CM-4 TaxID=1354277 RepID=UPI000388510A|nr:GrpB family protein [Virgibacillus sp. CM-4]EQB34913.1 hypothetical protein M948_17545 [Virgibacillus sp. CM-4]